jgi:hypothetical protein
LRAPYWQLMFWLSAAIEQLFTETSPSKFVSIG